jgi:translation initiation factor 2B subunit (eIF-2B alpha/beta/delta family)
MNVYTAVARNGGLVDDVGTFSTQIAAREQVREWAGEMKLVSRNEDDFPEEGEFESVDGEIWWFDIWTTEMQTPAERARELLDEIVVSELLGDAEDPEVSDSMRSLLQEMQELVRRI